MNGEHVTKPGLGIRCECCSTGFLETQYRQETIPYEAEGSTISVSAERVPFNVCSACGSVFVTAETAKARHEYVCRAVGAVTPSEIREIRERHGLSQSDFARITKFGEASISRWERGRLLPSPSNSTYLRLLLENPSVVDLLIKSEDAAESRAEARVGPQEANLAGQVSRPTRRFHHLPEKAMGRLIDRAKRFELVGYT